jgi:serine protease Do
MILACLLIALSCQAAPAAEPAPTNLRRTVVVDVAERTKHSVVYISTRKLVSQRINAFGGDPFFEKFFDFGDRMRVVPGGSLGSGFIVHPDGYIVTNNHVVDRARQIEVELLDGGKLPADLVSADPESDLAVLKINTDKPLPAVELGDSSDLLIGEPVIAVGNPLGFSHTVSTGIVSANHRDLKDDAGEVILGDLIQTDAAINPGNSGGPLLNAYGQVIGINTAVRGDAQNIGFAIQVNKLRDLIPELMNPAQVNKLDIPIKLRETRKVTPPATVRASVVFADGGAAIDSIAGHRPRDIVDAHAILLRQRDGEPFDVVVAGGEKRSITPRAMPTPDAIVQASERLGITVEELTPLTAQKYGLLDERGMLVTQVRRGGVAAKAGLQPGDVIIALGRYPVTSLKEFTNLMQLLPDSGKVGVGVSRGGQRGWGILQL